MHNSVLLRATCLVFAGALLTARAELAMPSVLSSRMVLQRDQPVPIWGTADAGARITVAFADQQRETAADATGRWLVRLDPLKSAAAGRSMTIVAVDPQGKREERLLDDVLVGEVWVGSGQSNMDMPVQLYTGQDPVLAAAAAQSYPDVRLIRSCDSGWYASDPVTNQNFSALLLTFGLALHRELGVPVGLMEGAVGGTPSGAWLSRQAYDAAPACTAAVAQAVSTFDADAHAQRCAEQLQSWSNLVAQAVATSNRPPRQPRLPLTPGECRFPVGHLYEKHIRPFQPFAIRGVLWDQGESGTGIGGVPQPPLMGALIRSWRAEWRTAGGAGASAVDFPFLFVQKPNGGGCAWDPADPVTARADPWVPLPALPSVNGLNREEHAGIAAVTGTVMVISSDLGSGTHPVNKSGYGERAARVALGKVYGRTVAVSGPVYASHRIEESRVRVQFAHVGQGLAWRHGERLQGFAVAGEDRQFRWADAVIEGDSVVVSADGMAKPVAVRYAWSQAHPWANLFNKDGLPAVAFRTDNW